MNYNEIRDHFTSSNERDNIYYRICTPKDMARGIIQISHGMCEYFDRYEGFIEYFTNKGFVVCGSDHIGHGNSAADKDSLGYMGENGNEYLADDLLMLNSIVRKKYRSLPYILLGHSMGSFVVRDYIMRYPDTIDGAVICGTQGSNKAVSAGIFLCNLLSLFRGKKHRSDFVRSIAFKAYNSRFKDEKDSLSWLTRVKSVREAYACDDFCNYTFTLDGFKNLFTLLKRVNEPEWEKRVPQSLPIMLIAGREDPVGNYGGGVTEVYDLLEAREVNMLEIKLYEGARHELFNEENKEEVFCDLEGFASRVIEGVLEARGYGRA